MEPFPRLSARPRLPARPRLCMVVLPGGRDALLHRGGRGTSLLGF